MTCRRMVGAVALGLAVAATAVAGPPQIDIYPSVREVGINDVIGGNGGTSGSVGLEFIDRGLNKLILDGTWQQFTWDLSNASQITGWANGNGTLDGDGGILDALIIEAAGPQPVQIWMDDWETTLDPAGLPAPSTTVLQDWEGFLTNDEVAFQEPGFSGSTDANLNLNVNYAGVDNTVSNGGSGSYQMVTDIDFNVASGGLFGYGIRFTTFEAGGTPIDPNQQLGWAGAGGTVYDSATMSIWLRGLPVPEPTSMALLGLGGLAVLRRRR
jgi:hypothetical protein